MVGANRRPALENGTSGSLYVLSEHSKPKRCLNTLEIQFWLAIG